MEILKNELFLFIRNILRDANNGKGKIIKSELFIVAHNFVKNQLNPTLAMETGSQYQAELEIIENDLHLSFYCTAKKSENNLFQPTSMVDIVKSKTKENITKAINLDEKIKSQKCIDSTKIEKHAWRPLEKNWVLTATALHKLLDENLREEIFSSEIVSKLEQNPKFMDPIEIRNPRNLTIKGTISQSKWEKDCAILRVGNHHITFSYEEHPEIGVLIGKAAPLKEQVIVVLRENYDAKGLSKHQSRYTAVSLRRLGDPKLKQVDAFPLEK